MAPRKSTTGLTGETRLTRRSLLKGVGGLLLADASVAALSSSVAGESTSIAQEPAGSEKLWEALDTEIRGWWNHELRHAMEREIRLDNSTQLLYLPFPFLTPSGGKQTFQEMFCWDSYFINRALLAHDRLDLVRYHILNYLFMVERFGYMPNANHAGATTRSQTPVFPDSVWLYYLRSGDRDLLCRAFALLKQEYRSYWNASHHSTPVGLATNRDLGDPRLPPELAAEAETGLDWTPIYGGDVRRCTPLITNFALVRYARVLALVGNELGLPREANAFASEADARAERIRKYCWNEQVGFFLEYDYIAGKQLPYISTCAYWSLWAGVATRKQAQQLVSNLGRLEQRYGLACTDKAYPDSRSNAAYQSMIGPDGRAAVAPDVPPEIVGGREWLQWMYPTGWAPEHLLTIQGLDAYGYESHAERIAAKFLGLLLNHYQKSGNLWEKYNVVDGSLVLPNSRYGNVPMHGWTAAAVALLGRRLFRREALQK